MQAMRQWRSSSVDLRSAQRQAFVAPAWFRHMPGTEAVWLSRRWGKTPALPSGLSLGSAARSSMSSFAFHLTLGIPDRGPCFCACAQSPLDAAAAPSDSREIRSVAPGAVPAGTVTLRVSPPGVENRKLAPAAVPAGT